MYPIAFFFSKINLSLQHFVFFFHVFLVTGRKEQRGETIQEVMVGTVGGPTVFFYSPLTQRKTLSTCLSFFVSKNGRIDVIVFYHFQKGAPFFSSFLLSQWFFFFSLVL
jgi:hypothetical protein